MEERLILVTSAADGTVDPDTYVQVDWGHDFAARFDPGLPGDVDPGLSIDFGPLALAYLIEAGGSGYFRQRAAAPHIASGRLHPVPGAPSFSYPVYAVRSAGTTDDLVEHAVAALRHATDSDSMPR